MLGGGRALLVAVVAAVALQRFAELGLSKRNEALLKARGGIEGGEALYPWLVALHVAFLAGLLIEGWWRGPSLGPLWPLWAALYLAAQLLRVWVILTLGERWCTRLVVAPGMKLATGGPYRLVRHPNYLAVVVELASLPLFFGAFYTAAAATAANALLLRYRVRSEEDLLERLTTYEEAFGRRPRLLPRSLRSP